MILQGFDTEGYIRLVTAFLTRIYQRAFFPFLFWWGLFLLQLLSLPFLFCCCLLEASSCGSLWLLWVPQWLLCTPSQILLLTDSFSFLVDAVFQKKSWLSRTPLTVSMLGLDTYTYPKTNHVPSSAGWSRHLTCVYLPLPQHIERWPEKAWSTVPKLLLVNAVKLFSFTERHFS